MKISAELSLYPLNTSSIQNAIEQFVLGLKARGLAVKLGPVSTLIAGEIVDVFRAVGECYELAANDGDVVLVAKFTNVSPLNWIDKADA